MALFNKLFTNRKTTYRNQDNVSEKLFAFSKDQVRVVLFRECDFRGRKLLFDSTSIKRTSVNPSKPREVTNIKENEKVSEISDGFAYVYTKPQPDFNQLAEMVFGSVAMSFRGTYFKMHSLESPARLMFTQVFSSPKHAMNSRRISISSRSFEHSDKLDDSGESSANSINERIGSTTSDTVLVCRPRYSAPLDVPLSPAISHSSSSNVGDSGYYADHSSTNISSGPASLSTFGSVSKENSLSTLSLSSGGLYKRWLKRNSTSLDNSEPSLLSSFSSSQDIGSPKHSRTSKLGLAFILHLTPGQEEKLSQFFMEHINILQAMVWRARQTVELAYIRSQNFASIMFEMANFSAQYLVNLLSGSFLSVNMWLSLSNGCDNCNSISAFGDRTFSSSNQLFEMRTNNFNSTRGLLNSYGQYSEPELSWEGLLSNGSSIFNRLLKSDWDIFNLKNSVFSEHDLAAEKFVKDFCELLEVIDVKATNFFMSTLVTAILTHHLGWVSTCLPAAQHQEKHPQNPLWGELTDLYGALGHPTKLAQTIITGTSRKDMVSKILVTMTYFIRCCDVDRRIPFRGNLEEENSLAEAICQSYACIPKENYKKYEDHLREFMPNNDNDFSEKNLAKTKSVGDLTKDLNKLSEINLNESHVERLKKSNKMCRIPSSIMLCDVNEEENAEEERIEGNSDVVFVLGDNEELIGLKKEANDKPTRPLFLSKSNGSLEDTGDFKDSDFIENRNSLTIKPSTSWTNLAGKEVLNQAKKISTEECTSKNFTRSQSVPPENGKAEESGQKAAKYQYFGVKFNLKQYPQVLSNYMKGKNLEMSSLHFGDKNLKIDELSSLTETIGAKYPGFDSNYDDGGLQTPSNASELEFTSDLFTAPLNCEQSRESNVESPSSDNLKNGFEDCDIVKTGRKISICNKMKVVELPMPETRFQKAAVEPVKYTYSLMRAPSEIYLPDMVLQGPLLPKYKWESMLKNDLALASQHSLIDQPVEEAVAIIANTDTWDVQLMSSHTFTIDRSTTGIRVGMSQLVGNMLESVLQMYKLNVPPGLCLVHLERTLQEICVRSKAVAEVLLTTEFCSIEHLTSTLHIEVNDVPLLLAIASTHTPQVTQKYGLSFQ